MSINIEIFSSPGCGKCGHAKEVLCKIADAMGGEWVQGIMGRQWGLLLGPVLIIMGLIWAGIINIRLSWFGVNELPGSGALFYWLFHFQWRYVPSVHRPCWLHSRPVPPSVLSALVLPYYWPLPWGAASPLFWVL